MATWPTSESMHSASAIKFAVFARINLHIPTNSIIPQGSWVYKFVNPKYRDVKKIPGIAILSHVRNRQ